MLRSALPAYASQIFRHRPVGASSASPPGADTTLFESLERRPASRLDDEPRYFSLSPATAATVLAGTSPPNRDPYCGTGESLLGSLQAAAHSRGASTGAAAMDAEVCFNLLARARADARVELAEARAANAELRARAETAQVRAEAEAAGAQAAVLAAMQRGRMEVERTATEARAEVRLARAEVSALRARLAWEEELGRTRLRANTAAMQGLLDAAEAEKARLQERVRILEAEAAAFAGQGQSRKGKVCNVT